jgi:enoyl-CoA hydratase/carnithine racemase
MSTTEELANGELLVDVRNHVAHLTLNRPAQLHALSFGMISAMAELFTRWATDDGIKAVVVRGAGEKAFCAGGDIRALRDSALSGSTLHHDFFIAEYALDYQLHRFVKPCISLLDGIVMGGGMGISQGSGFRIVGPRTRMAMPETGIGLFPDVGGSYFLSRATAPLGLYLGLTGHSIKAADALYAGLADRYMTAAAIAELFARLDRLLWTRDPGRDVARLIDALASTPPQSPSLLPLRQIISRHFTIDHAVAEMIASLENNTAAEHRDWAHSTAALLKKRSPTMLEVTHEEIRRGASMSLADCFRMELGIVFHCFEHGDMMEGIRAVIIDKDNDPQWKPATLAELDRATVNGFFAPRWDPATHPLSNLERQFG